MKRGNRVLLELKNIYKSFRNNKGDLRVLEDISIKIQEGEIVALVGPSGCGKTTLLNIISGLLVPDKGDLFLKEGLRLAYIFQEPRLLPWKSVTGNIAFVQENFLPEEEGREVRERLLARTGLLDYKDVYPAQLSGGMKQRLEMVRALAIKPELVLMDEPFKSLDIGLKYQLQELLLEEYRQQAFAIFLITHDPEEAVLLADRVIILSDKPTGIRKEIRLDIPRQERSLKNEEIYSKFEEILALIL
ncbi:MAG TPA: ATP-binding cassette domain-containing protein [Halanaerobiales bacterium]|nr:ATP-binding cassette domain-containing protein [Halanaerobiales bacterium]HPZ63555.1 ATP-binding cassette domain-containing protein [Halanaerobiales bacterium]HQD04809.1 ATP-binding cassette domain-containing protein [Halanaerobiales bacterium]